MKKKQQAMNKKIEEIKRSLIDSYYEKDSIHKGNLGEMIAIHHFEATNQSFIHVNQSSWSYPEKMKLVDAKRPDFFIIENFKIIKIVDVKLHSLNENYEFKIDSSEILQYVNLHEYLMNTFSCKYDDIKFEFFIIPSHHTEEKYSIVSFEEMISSQKSEFIKCGENTIQTYTYSVSIKDRLKNLFIE